MSLKLYRWAKFGQNLLRANAQALRHPYKLMFVVTKRCHSRCVYCDIWKAKDDPQAMARELTLDEVERFARANRYFQWIDFTGGEPTDRPDFPEVVRTLAVHCRDLLLVHFPTNGIATKRIVAVTRAIQATVTARLVVTVSVDGPPEINDGLRGIRNDFEHAMETFSQLQAVLGSDVYIGMTLHGHSRTCGMTSAQLLLATFEAINSHRVSHGAEPIGWQQFHVNIPHFSEHYYNNASTGATSLAVHHKAELQAAIALLLEKNGRSLSPMRVIERIYRQQALEYLKHGRTPVRCEALHSTTYVAENGTVFPCTIWNRPLGNIREHEYRLQPIIAAAHASGIRRQVMEDKCPRCWTPCEAYHAIAGNLVRGFSRTATT